MESLPEVPVQPADVSLMDGLSSTRAIRRYTDEPIPDRVLRDIFFAATRAPSGSNRQPFRFLVLRDGPTAVAAKRLIANGARAGSPKARMAATMQQYVDSFASVPVLILPCLNRYRDPEYTEGANVYPACQNLLLAARGYGYGGVMTMFHKDVEPELRALLAIPDGTAISATITLGRPVGSHGPVRRRPMAELVYEETWGQSASWAVDPPGTTFTAAGPPKSVTSGSGRPAPSAR